MATLILSSHRAERSFGCVGVIFDGQPSPIPSRRLEIKRMADAAVALEQYKAEALATGKAIAVAMRIANGDSVPDGFKALQRPFYHPLNV
jgi:hypothetical protein